MGSASGLTLYRLRCALQSADGRSGNAFDSFHFDAATVVDAIARASRYKPSNPEQTVSTLVLTDLAGTVIWTRTCLLPDR